ncbi:hypothetical protein RB653_009387 [Dictyostelium firmibasis]|uniref:Armadillo repeat-containing protein n=1 Tax=Dictyostelium firmibasis TaxID=79012 RepID=A0AAN7U1Y9_9MYCE
MSAINLRLLQDSEIENFGSPKNVNDLMEEVRGLFDNYTIKFVPSANNKMTIGLNSSPVAVKNSINQKSPQPQPQSQPQPSSSSTSPNSVSNRLLNNGGNNNNSSNNILKPSERLFKLNNTNTTTSSTSQTPQQIQQINNNLNIINQQQQQQQTVKKNPIESSFIDVKKIGIKELSLLLTKRREGSVHIQAIKQIGELYQQACSNNSHKQQFLEEVNKGTCLRSLLSYLTISQPKIDSFEYNSQLEALKVISILTGNDSIKSFIKQTGDIPIIVQVLNWSHKLPTFNSFNLSLINLISNLATQESCASILRKAGSIGPIFSMSINETISNDLRIIALNTLIIFSSYSDPKISEAIVDSKQSLELIFNNIINNCITNNNNNVNSASNNQLSIKFLDLLYQVSDCAKTRAIAFECGIEKLLTLLRIDLIYPQELNRVNYFRIGNVANNYSKQVLDSTEVQTSLQSKVLSCLEKLSKHELNRTKLGLHATELILTYSSTMFKIPRDVFKWNTLILERTLKLAIHMLQDDNHKQVFVEKDGCKNMVWMVQQSDLFSSSVLLSCAQVLSIVVTPKKSSSNSIQISIEKIIESDVIPSLMKLYKSFPDEKSLKILMCNVFKHLGTIDDNKQIIFSEGGYQLLHNLLNTDDLEVVSNSLDTLTVLSTNNFIRKVLRLLGTISVIIEKVSIQNSSIKKSTTNILNNISQDSEGVELISNGLSPAILNSLLYGNESEIQISVVLMIENLISFDENYLEKFIGNGGIPSLLNSLYSNNEQLQFQVLILLNRIIKNSNAQTIILNSGIVNKLKSLSTHENVVKTNSTLIDPMRSFIIAVKSIPQPEPEPQPQPQPQPEPHPQPQRQPQQQSQQQSHSQSQPQQKSQEIQEAPKKQVQPIKKEQSTNILIGNRSTNSTKPVPEQIKPVIPPEPVVIQKAVTSSPPQQPQPQQASTKPQQLPDFKKIESVLCKLSQEQLKDVVLELIKQNTQLADILPTSIRNVITSNLLPYPTVPTPQPQPVSSVTPPSTSPTLSSSGSIPSVPTPPPPPPPLPSLNLTLKPTKSSPTTTSSSPFSPSQLNNVQLKPTIHVKKESSTTSGGVISPADILNSSVYKKRENDPTPIAEIGSSKNSHVVNNFNSGNSPFSHLMNELQTKVKNNTLNLQHIDTQQQIETRRKDRLMKQNVGILKDIVSNAAIRNKNNVQKKRLVDSSMIQGKRIWKKSFDLFAQEVSTIFKRYDVFSILVFKILDEIEDFSFKEALEISGFTDSELLAQQLLRIGFNLKSSTYVLPNSDDPTTEYEKIVKPTGMPIKMILCILVQFIQQ